MTLRIVGWLLLARSNVVAGRRCDRPPMPLTDRDHRRRSP
jgi:hypothetical protein